MEVNNMSLHDEAIDLFEAHEHIKKLREVINWGIVEINELQRKNSMLTREVQYKKDRITSLEYELHALKETTVPSDMYITVLNELNTLKRRT